MSLRDQTHSEQVAFFQKIANDPGLNQEQRKAAIKTYVDQQKAKLKARREEQNLKYQSEKAKIREADKQEGASK